MTTSLISESRIIEALIEQRQDINQQSSGINRQVLPELLKLLDNPFVIVISGLRRSGKSTLLKQLIDNKLGEDYYYVNFDDERLVSLTTEYFSVLEQALISEFGTKKYYLFDEIQNIDRWELFVRRLHNQGKKVIVTGSNASLLSKELGSRLTGRHLILNLFPFSFEEYQTFHRSPVNIGKTTSEKGLIKKHLKRYLLEGGIPLALQYPQLPIIKQLYQDILNRDIIRRYNIGSDRELQEFSLFLVSNTASLISLNKLRQLIKVKNVSTLTNYLDYLSKSWLFGVVNKYSPSVKTQQIAPKKIYVSDTAFANQIGFKFSDNAGKLLETIVYWDLIKSGQRPYYYKTATNHEVDFYLPDNKHFIQVCADIEDTTTKDREYQAITMAQAEISHPTTFQVITLANYVEWKLNPNLPTG